MGGFLPRRSSRGGLERPQFPDGLFRAESRKANAVRYAGRLSTRFRFVRWAEGMTVVAA
ncbi:hypothetical protein KCP77_24650 (plasmid) [Salmonella enterica subsp. enterica]|nr:hypothetical protein KCP77_24650 [Salmonella enterica subsp. enterica]